MKKVNIKEIYEAGYAKTGHYIEDPRLVKMITLLRKDKVFAETILDVGCGDGIFSLKLKEVLQAKEVCGVDISTRAVQDALTNNVKALRLDIDQENLPFEDAKFDFIFCGNLIELVLDPDHLLEELVRVLKPQGRLILIFPNLCSWASRIAILLGRQPYYDLVSRRYDVGKLGIPAREFKDKSKGFVRLYSYRAFLQLVSFYGLRIEKAVGAQGSGAPYVINVVDKILCKVPQWAFQVICILKKTNV